LILWDECRKGITHLHGIVDWYAPITLDIFEVASRKGSLNHSDTVRSPRGYFLFLEETLVKASPLLLLLGDK
jgi:hypothetical protein